MTETTNLATVITDKFKIPARPQAVIDIEEELHKKVPDIEVIAAAIRGDVAISGATLQVMNSPYFRIHAKVSSIPDAIRFLGLDRVGLVVRHVALKNFLGDTGLERFWDTTIEIAELAEMLSIHLTGLDRDQAYTAGLFHDCGFPLMIQLSPGLKTIFEETDDPVILSKAEEEICGVNHYEVGAVVGKKWFLSEQITKSIEMLPKAETILMGEQDEDLVIKQLMALILMAKNIIRSIRQFWRASEVVAEVPVYVLKIFGLSQEDYEDLVDSMVARLDKQKQGEVENSAELVGQNQ